MNFHNVGTSDSIEEAVAALKHLQKVTCTVFDRIEARVATERARVDALGSRISKAAAQINSIAEHRSNKATTVFSQARFPGVAPSKSDFDGLPAYQPIFSGMPRVDCPPDDLMKEDAPRVFPANDGEGAQTQPSQADMLDLLWRANQAIDPEDPAQMGAPSGIGPLPRDVMSVTNFMLYNSNDTPYTKYDHTLDNMFEVKQRDSIEEEEKRKMAAQGATLLAGDQLPAVAALDMSYKPTMKQQPTLQFQTNLDFGASLPAVASDAAWSQGDSAMGSIAPSALVSALPALPALADAPSAPSGPSGGGASAPPAPAAPSTNNAAAPPPPPPPPPSAAPQHLLPHLLSLVVPLPDLLRGADLARGPEGLLPYRPVLAPKDRPRRSRKEVGVVVACWRQFRQAKSLGQRISRRS